MTTTDIAKAALDPSCETAIPHFLPRLPMICEPLEMSSTLDPTENPAEWGKSKECKFLE